MCPSNNRTLHAYEVWASHYDTDPNPQTHLERPWVCNALKLSPGNMILDAACGTGYYAGHCAAAGCRLVGVDFSPAMLRIAQNRVPAARFVLADLEAPLPFAAQQFDTIVCAQALKHLPRLENTLAEFHRVLRPGGQCIVSVTHPLMDWTGYAMRGTPHLLLASESNIYHHAQTDYERAFEFAGFPRPSVGSILVDESIRHLLTEKSFRMVVGRPQIALMTVTK